VEEKEEEIGGGDGSCCQREGDRSGRPAVRGVAGVVMVRVHYKREFWIFTLKP
jgi:hypothetical protein